MTENASTVLRDALALSPDERAYVAADLIASLEESRDDPAAVGGPACDIQPRDRATVDETSA